LIILILYSATISYLLIVYKYTIVIIVLFKKV